MCGYKPLVLPLIQPLHTIASPAPPRQATNLLCPRLNILSVLFYCISIVLCFIVQASVLHRLLGKCLFLTLASLFRTYQLHVRSLHRLYNHLDTATSDSKALKSALASMMPISSYAKRRLGKGPFRSTKAL